MRIVISASNGKSLVNFRGSLIREMIHRGHEVICTSIEPLDDMKDEINKLGAKYHCIPGTRTDINIFSNIKMIVNFIRAYRVLKPDLCFLYMSKPVVFGGLAAIICRIRHIVVFVTGLEVVFYSNGIKNIILRIILIIFFKIVHRKCDSVFFMSHDDYTKMLRWKVVKKDQAILVNGSGVNMEHFTRKDMPEADTVCMTARLLWSKGIREYAQAAEIVRIKYPWVNFLLVGGLDENPEALSEQELEAIIKKGYVHYYGYTEDVRPYLEECSIFVLPSYHEGNGRSIVEAEAVGRPVITTTAPGCCETVIDGYNGFLIPPKDGKALADKIILLLENKKMKMNMAEYSYQLCCEKYDVRLINQVFIENMKL
jgi:glycosyltransferase involved in cell wall biosynthesis